MARSRIPDPLARRHLVARELAPDKALATAEAYLEQGRSVDAVEFLAKADARERLGELRAEAVAAGDLFLLRAAASALGESPSAEEWNALADAAESAGMLRYAADARRQAQRGEE